MHRATSPRRSRPRRCDVYPIPTSHFGTCANEKNSVQILRSILLKNTIRFYNLQGYCQCSERAGLQMRQLAAAHAIAPEKTVTAQMQVRAPSSILHHSSCVLHHASCIISSFVLHHAPCIIHHIHHSIIHHSSFILHHPSCIMHHASFVMCHSSSIIHHSTLITHHAKLLVR